MLFTHYKRPALCVLSGAMVAASLFAAPLALANTGTSAAQQQEVRPIPAQVSKGIQQLVGLLPELSSTHVVLNGEVDGPGVSGIAVSFLPSSAQAEGEAQEQEDQAIFDAQTGKLLFLSFHPKKAVQSDAFTEEQAKSRAVSFVSGLQSSQSLGNTYHVQEVNSSAEGRTVRLVRKLNNIVLDDAYDVFVTFDAGGRLIEFRTHNGRMHEAISRTDLPSAQRVISVEQAEAHFAKNAPVEKVYLLPNQANGVETEEVKLVYVVKGGVVTNSYTASAVDAVTGEIAARTYAQQPEQASQEVVRTAALQGTGETWAATTEEEAGKLINGLFQVNPAGLPLHTFDEDWGTKQVRYYVWGHFAEDVAEADLPYYLGTYPEDATAGQRKHLMLVVDAKSGELIRFLHLDDTQATARQDKERDRKVADDLLARLLPTGANQLKIRESAGGEYTLILADPIVNGIPVYRAGQTVEDAMYRVIVDSRSGAVQEVSLQRPNSPVYPQASQAISEEEAVSRLLKGFPLILTYVHESNPQTEKVEWKLVYDLSFRQTDPQCFCGPERLVDDTIRIDALTGEMTVEE